MKTKVMLASFLAIIGLTAFIIKNEKSVAGNFARKTFIVDEKSSTVEWLAKKVAGQHKGTVKLSKGEMKVSKENITGGSFEMDMTTINVTDLEGEWKDKLVNHLKSEDFFSVTKHPNATFVITKAEKNKDASEGNPNYRFKGNLTIKGITKEISFPATVSIKDNILTGNADFIINRTWWDIRYGSKTFFETIGDKAIEDEFNLKLNIIAKKK